MKVYLRFCYNYSKKIIKKKRYHRNEKEFYCNYKNILKNKNIPKYCFEIIEKDGSTCFLSTNYFDVINFEILNIFGYIGVKFEIITAYENGKLVETQIIVDDIELIKVEKFF